MYRKRERLLDLRLDGDTTTAQFGFKSTEPKEARATVETNSTPPASDLHARRPQAR
jgi:hypothetical protein